MNIQEIDWGTVFANYIPDKGIIPTTCKEQVKLNNKNTNNPI